MACGNTSIRFGSFATRKTPPDFYGAIVRSRRLATFAALARTGLPR